MTKQEHFNQEERSINNAMDREAESKNFIPVVGMQPTSFEGNGYKGTIEYVGRDYFVLRSERTDLPILIHPSQYYNFVGWKVPTDFLHPVFKNITDSIFNPHKK